MKVKIKTLVLMLLLGFACFACWSPANAQASSEEIEKVFIASTSSAELEAILLAATKEQKEQILEEAIEKSEERILHGFFWFYANHEQRKFMLKNMRVAEKPNSVLEAYAMVYQKEHLDLSKKLRFKKLRRKAARIFVHQ